jgi:predicted TIM-barrel fold metal-dependent hydrolase
MEEFVKFRSDTRKPAEQPPPKSCDCQVHVFGPLDRYPTRSGASYVPPVDANDEAAERMHRTLGLEYGVIVQATAYGTDNRAMVDALKGRPNYRGVAIVDDSISDQELRRMHEAGVRGARFNFWKQLNIVPTPDGFERSIARISELGWHARIHAAGDEWLGLKDLLAKPKIPMVIDHMGHPDLRGGVDQPALRLLRDFLKRENWWVMVSNADRFSAKEKIWDDVDAIAEGYLKVAPDRAIWCTDWPHVQYRKPMPNDAELLEFLLRVAPEPALRRKVLADNPACLHGFQ